MESSIVFNNILFYPRETMTDDEQLVQRIKNGDTAAFSQLVLKHQDFVYNFCAKVYRNREDAEDLSQEIFLKAYKGINNFRGDAKFSTWLYKIMINEISNKKKFDFRRNELKKATRIDEFTAEKIKLEIKDNNFNPEKYSEKKEIINRVINEINNLSPEQRETLYLREINNMSYEDIAKIMHCSIGTVKSRINRGRQVLQHKLSDYFNEL